MQTAELSNPNKSKLYFIYILMLLGTVAAFFWIVSLGDNLTAPAPAAIDPDAPVKAIKVHVNTLLHVLFTLAVVIVSARVVGAIFHFLNQPPVIGEVIAGIMLGPSLLGHFAPEASRAILPPDTAPYLGMIAQLGVILYMFFVGLELDLRVLRKSGHSTLAISHASIIIPFLLGTILAYFIYTDVSDSSVSFTSFALFLGVSMSVTAFPVLARILTDRRINRSEMGTIALTCAAVDDVTAWCLLAFVVSIAQQSGGALQTMVLTVLFIALMLVVGRPLVAWILPVLERREKITETGLTVIFVAMLISAFATELIGIHAIFGAFLLGAIIPNNSRTAGELTENIEAFVRVMFLPAFFAFTGMRTQFGLIVSAQDWLLCGVIIAVASAGKFGGTLFAARLTGLNWRNSAALGILMNTRGLVELIVLNIGLDLGIISPRLFAMLVIMALVTTFMTTPILHFLTRNHPWIDAPNPKPELIPPLSEGAKA